MDKAIKYPNLLAEMAKNKDTQKTLAQIINLSQGSISRKLAGEVEWKLEEVNLICEYYKKTYEELFKK